MRIMVRDVSNLRQGQWVANVDDERYAFGTLVPEDHYAVEDQEWLRVERVSGYVDLPTVVLNTGNDTVTVQQQSSALTWVLVDDEGHAYTGNDLPAGVL